MEKKDNELKNGIGLWRQIKPSPEMKKKYDERMKEYYSKPLHQRVAESLEGLQEALPGILKAMDEAVEEMVQRSAIREAQAIIDEIPGTVTIKYYNAYERQTVSFKIKPTEPGYKQRENE